MHLQLLLRRGSEQSLAYHLPVSRRASRRWVAGLSAALVTAAGCADLLGIGDYRDFCKPYGVGDPPDCVYGPSGASTTTGSGGAGASDSTGGGGTGAGAGGNGGAGGSTRVVVGERSATFVTPSNQHTNTVDLSETHLGAYVWSSGGFEFHPAQGSPNGTFDIDDVPVGDYALSFGDSTKPTFYVTNANHVDLSYVTLGGPAQTPAKLASPVTLNVANLSLWEDTNHIDFVSLSNGASIQSLELYDVPPDPGSASWSTTFDWSLVPFPPNLMSQFDTLTITQLATATNGGATYLAASRAATIAFTQTDGTPVTQDVTLAPVPQDQQIALTWSVDSFDQLAPEVNPDATPQAELFDLFVGLQAADGQAATAPFPPRLAEFAPPTGAPVSTTLTYGDPFPASALRYAVYKSSFAVQVTLSGAPARTFTASATTWHLVSGNADTTTPIISPPHNVNIDGASFWSPATLVTDTPVVTWDGPMIGQADAYLVTVYDVHVSGGRLTFIPTGFVTTPRKKLRIPPGLIPAGGHTMIVVTAVAQPGLHLETAPFRSTLPYATAPAISAVFTAP
ncbi:MAG TPA: hypothetical protein VHB21_09440 [Minicystis sp.]|nr:hypothetical protein [Minicystis sp.]